MRERGLKHRKHLIRIHASHVVPRAGTWIETSDTMSDMLLDESFPVRERGLKRLVILVVSYIDCVSFPVRERGLKHSAA